MDKLSQLGVRSAEKFISRVRGGLGLGLGLGLGRTGYGLVEGAAGWLLRGLRVKGGGRRSEATNKLIFSSSY